MCSQIYPDPQAEKAIMASVVYCIHHKEGCAWAGELRKLKVRIQNESIPSQLASQFATFVCVSLFHRSRKQVYIYAGGSPELVRTCLEGLSLLSQLGAPPPPGVRAPIDCTSVRKQPFESHTLARRKYKIV